MCDCVPTLCSYFLLLCPFARAAVTSTTRGAAETAENCSPSFEGRTSKAKASAVLVPSGGAEKRRAGCSLRASASPSSALLPGPSVLPCPGSEPLSSFPPPRPRPQRCAGSRRRFLALLRHPTSALIFTPFSLWVCLCPNSPFYQGPQSCWIRPRPKNFS